MKDRYEGSLISYVVALGRRLTSKFSLSELAISSLLLAAIIILAAGYLSQNMFAGRSVILQINGSTSYTRDDLSEQLEFYVTYSPGLLFVVLPIIAARPCFERKLNWAGTIGIVFTFILTGLISYKFI